MRRLTDVERQVERMFRAYPTWKKELSVLWPTEAFPDGYIQAGKRQYSTKSPTETVGVARAELSTRIDLVNRCLRLMTYDERRYVRLRYFQELPVWSVEREMHWSRRQLQRLRLSCLAKAAWLWGLLKSDPAFVA